nr:MAG TPA: hypothetical protein [Caudoviricetes sp.]
MHSINMSSKLRFSTLSIAMSMILRRTRPLPMNSVQFSRGR